MVRKKKPEKVICKKCGRPGYLKVHIRPSGKYLYVRHVEECYIGKEGKV